MPNSNERILAACGATVGLMGLPALCYVLAELGPAARIKCYSYLGLEILAKYAAAAVLGLLLGAEAVHLLRPSVTRYRTGRLAGGAVLGAVVGLVVQAGLLRAGRAMGLGSSWPTDAVTLTCVGFFAWVGAVLFYKPSAAPWPRRLPWVRFAALFVFLAIISIPHLRAFPAHASIAERDAWARRHVREYASLVRIVASVPEVVADVGRITAVAPTSNDRHVYARTMNGDEMRFALDIVGGKGAGVFRAVCTVMGDVTVEWEEGRWIFGGKETPIPASPAPFRLPQPRGR